MSPAPFLLAGLLFTGVILTACAGKNAAPSTRESLHFSPQVVTSDGELAKWSDEELFTAGTAAFANNDYRQATRYFGRLVDFHPQSPHWRKAAYSTGLAHERLQEWDAAYERFAPLADPAHGKDDALDASFRVAETLYHLERFDEAVKWLNILSARADLPLNPKFEALVQKGICEVEWGKLDLAEKTLRGAMAEYAALDDKRELNDYFPAQAQFFLGEIFRLHYEGVQLLPERSVDQLAKDLEYKSELLLSAQGHYLRCIRVGNGYWATAAGSQIGALYQDLYEHMVKAPTPGELEGDQIELYRKELRKKIRVLITKAINMYESTLETAERLGTVGPFIERTRESLDRMKVLLLSEPDDPTKS